MEIESLLKKQREFYNTRITDDVNYRIKNKEGRVWIWKL